MNKALKRIRSQYCRHSKLVCNHGFKMSRWKEFKYERSRGFQPNGIGCLRILMR